MTKHKIGLSDNWLRKIENVYLQHAAVLDGLDEHARHDRLCELNVIEQVVNVSRTTVLQEAWQRGQAVAVHGIVYGIRDGLLRDLNVSVAKLDEWPQRRREALAALLGQRAE